MSQHDRLLLMHQKPFCTTVFTQRFNTCLLYTSGAADHKDIFIPCVLRLLRAAVHRQPFRLRKQHIVLKNRVDVGPVSYTHLYQKLNTIKVNTSGKSAAEVAQEIAAL